MNIKPQYTKPAAKKHRLSLLPLESIQIDAKYTFNLNMSDEFETLLQNVEQYKYFLKKYISPYCTFELFPELSPLGRLHYHGYITFYDSLKLVDFYFSIRTFMSYCAMKIGHLNDDKIWDDYIFKQQSHMQYAFEIQQLPYKLDNKVVKSAKAVHVRDIFSDSAFELDHGLDDDTKEV